MQENNLKGLWIPYEILTNEHLSDKEKHIYSLILFFSKNDGFCTITNKYIVNTRVSKLISSLSKKNYVQVITNFQDTTRQIYKMKGETSNNIYEDINKTNQFQNIKKLLQAFNLNNNYLKSVRKFDKFC